MGSFGAYEAKTHFNQLLDRVTRGEKITITRHGIPIAILQSADSSKRVPVREIIEQIKRFSQGHRLEGISIREMIEEGRR